MKLYNSLTSSFEELKIKNKTLNIYSCGPTVYNYIHLGNARPAITMDFLVRFLRYQGYIVNYLQNITDIDDKIINKAIVENQEELLLSDFYTKAYLKDLVDLNVEMPSKIIKVSEVIPEMISFIEKMIANQSAYLSDGDVYFDLEKYKDEYGKLSNRKFDEIAHSRLEEVGNKKKPMDFAVWKKTKIGIKWNPSFGEGRPGWHTECALLNDLYFDHQTINIHGGGIDLKFPHHENERIQYLAVNHRELAEVWMHNGHLTVGLEKMSKSLGNFILVRDFTKKHDADLLRWLFMTSSYTQPLDINDDLLFQGEKFFEKLNNLQKKAKQLFALNELIDETTTESLNHYLDRFSELMNDNLNTSLVLTEIEKAIKEVNKDLQLKKLTTNYEELKQILKVLGFRFQLDHFVAHQDILLFQEWQKNIKEQNYQKADELRETLMTKGLI